MKFTLFICCLVLTLVRNSAFLFKSPNDVVEPELMKWDGLKVRFGFLPNRNFLSKPRTTTDALSQGYTKISECDLSAPWRGARYVKNDDFSLILLYDVTGYIAGVQTTVPSNLKSGFPHPAQRPPFVEDGPDRMVITAYFVHPAIICTIGRSSQDVDDQGTGTGLYFQNGTVPESDIVLIPRWESDVAETKWSRGKCFPKMGVHYGYNLRTNMDCDEYFPAFLMYNKGQLTGFGWNLVTYVTSPNLELVSWHLFPLFMRPMPRCFLKKRSIISSQHIYLTDNVKWNCRGELFNLG